jgi:TRAP-type mannitol/chloroaromatic compound transport system permease large subunit
LPGGLTYTVIIVGAVLSAVTGFVSASVITLGLISTPAMLLAGYDHRLATGTIAAAGTLAQVLPPSLVLIVLAEQLDVSLIDVYRGALLPGALLIGLYFCFIFLVTLWKPRIAPPAVRTKQHDPAIKFRGWIGTTIAAGLPLGLVLGVLASIYFGIATPSEGGAIGATGALLVALMRRRLTLPTSRKRSISLASCAHALSSCCWARRFSRSFSAG